MREIRTSKKRIRIGFDGIVNSKDESVQDTRCAVLCHNFAFCKGALTGEIGIDRASGYYASPSLDRHEYVQFPSSSKIKKAFLYRKVTASGFHDDRIVAQLEDGTFWYTCVFMDDVWTKVPTLVMDGDVDAVNYNFNGKDVLLLSSSVDGVFMIDDGEAVACARAPKFTSIAVHNERVFGSVSGANNQVWFSDDFDPSNWTISETEAGFINFADDCGEVVKVVSFLGYLYVFREYGIFRLTAYGDQNDFILKKVFTDTGRIYKDTIALAGDKILFCAEDGVFAFDGYDVVKTMKEMPKVANKNTMQGAYLDGCYYVACELEEIDAQNNNAIVKFDTESKEMSVLANVAIKNFCTVKTHNGSDILCVFLSENRNKLGMLSQSGAVLGVPTKKVYQSPHTIVGDTRLKIVREVSMVCKYPLVLKVCVDGREYKYSVRQSQKLQKITIEKSGYTIAFALESSEEKAYVANMNAYIEVARGEV